MRRPQGLLVVLHRRFCWAILLLGDIALGEQFAIPAKVGRVAVQVGLCLPDGRLRRPEGVDALRDRQIALVDGVLGGRRVALGGRDVGVRAWLGGPPCPAAPAPGRRGRCRPPARRRRRPAPPGWSKSRRSDRARRCRPAAPTGGSCRRPPPSRRRRAAPPSGAAGPSRRRPSSTQRRRRRPHGESGRGATVPYALLTLHGRPGMTLGSLPANPKEGVVSVGSCSLWARGSWW